MRQAIQHRRRQCLIIGEGAAACAHRLQQRWRTVDPLVLEEVAGDLWRDERLRALSPETAAVTWLDPVEPTHF